MLLEPESRLALDPELILRPDVDRVVLLTRPIPLADREPIFRLVHPTEAIILSLLDGKRTVRDVTALWAKLTGKGLPQAEADISHVLGFFTGGEKRERDRVLIRVTEEILPRLRVYDPLQFVIPQSAVNLIDRRLRIPYMVYFLPTLYCPHRCVYCFAKTRAQPEVRFLGVHRLREIFAELKDIGVEVVSMSGGEVFARPDIFEILEAVVQSGLVPYIPTKFGLSLDMAFRLRDTGIRIVQFSIDSSDPGIMDVMVGMPGYHSKALRALENLRQAGLTVRVNAVVTPINVCAIRSLLEYLAGLGNVKRISLSPYSRSTFRHNDGLFLSAGDLDSLSEQVSEVQTRYPDMRITVGSNGVAKAQDAGQAELDWCKRAFCTANRDGFVILPDGRVTPCEELYDHPYFLMGDLSRQSVMQMWNSPEARALLSPDQSAVPAGPCRTCDEFVTCNSGRGRCWRDVLKSYGWDKPYWPDPRCPKATPGNRLN